jgi:dTDP-4-dehydrorhamnose reductase
MQDRFHTVPIIHRSESDFERFGIFGDAAIWNVDVLDFDHVAGILHAVRPDVVLSCAGITKRKPAINDPLQAIGVNALFPHRLAEWAANNNARVIHFSTDCVFDGADGPYDEDSVTTGKDAYGQTKALGEIRYDHCLTIRSSFIGRELMDGSELLDWFLSQEGSTIRGFSRAFYSGVSTTFMSRLVADIIEHHPELSGLYQLSTEQPVSKFDLLTMAGEAFGSNIVIEDDPSFETMPTLDGSRLREAIDFSIPSWPDMLAELAAEPHYNQDV